MPSLLDEAMKVGKDLEGAEQRLRTIQQRIDQEEKRGRELVAGAEQQARKLLQSAKDDAAKLLKHAEAQERLWVQKVQEVEAREKGVAWVQDEQLRLERMSRDLSTATKQAEQARSASLTQQKLYADKVQQLSDLETALVSREQVVVAKEKALKLVPELMGKKAKK